MVQTGNRSKANKSESKYLESERECKKADLEVVEKKMTRYQIDREKYGVPWFLNWFRIALGESHITIEELSKKTGIAETTLTYYRNGVRNPTLRNFLLVVDALGKTIEIK